jgi:hypothetical protein
MDAKSVSSSKERSAGRPCFQRKQLPFDVESSAEAG